MSQSELERFSADLQSNEVLREELAKNASSVASIVAFAKAHGYDVTVEEVEPHLRAQTGRDLSDDELDSVAGGYAMTVIQAVFTNVSIETNVNAAVSNESSVTVQNGGLVIV